MDQLSLERDQYGLNHNRSTEESTYHDGVAFTLIEDVHDSIREFHYEPKWLAKSCASQEVAKARELNELSGKLLELYIQINSITNAVRFISQRSDPSLHPSSQTDCTLECPLDIGERYRPDFNDEKTRLELELTRSRQNISEYRTKMRDLVRHQLHGSKSTMFSIHASNWPFRMPEKFFFRIQTRQSAVLFNEDGFFCTKAKAMAIDFENDPISESDIISHLNQTSSDLSPFVAMTQEPEMISRFFSQIEADDQEATTISVIDSNVLTNIGVPFECIKDVLARIGGGLEDIACPLWVAHYCIPKEAVKMTLSMNEFQAFLDTSKTIGFQGHGLYVIEEDIGAEVAVRASAVQLVEVQASVRQKLRRR